MIGKRKLLAFALGTLSNSLLAFLGKIDPGVYSVVAVALVVLLTWLYLSDYFLLTTARMRATKENHGY